MNDMSKKHIFWYCEKWQVGGIQTVQVSLLKHFPRDSFDFDIVVSEDDTSIYDDDIKACGARKIVTLSRKYKSPAMRIIANMFAMRKLLRTVDYDAAHFNVCHGVELSYVFLAKLAGIPKRIVHCRNNDIGAGGKSRPIKLLAHRICKRLFAGSANVKLANSNLAAEWLFTEKDIKKDKVSVISNGIEMERYHFNEGARDELRDRLGLQNTTVIGHIGHFSYQKNHEFLLEIFKSYNKLDPEAMLVLIGEGEGERTVRDLAETLGILDKVLFVGVTKNIPSYLWAMDVFVFPSRFEGFGNVLIEAQAAGLECFASKDVIPEAVKITEALHWIPLSDSAEQWAQQIASRKERNDRSAMYQEAAASQYSIERMTEEIAAIYLDHER